MNKHHGGVASYRSSEGKTVKVLRKAPAGDPYQVRVGSTTEIAIRKTEAKLVLISKS